MGTVVDTDSCKPSQFYTDYCKKVYTCKSSQVYACKPSQMKKLLIISS
jgi:hypothetical protein